MSLIIVYKIADDSTLHILTDEGFDVNGVPHDSSPPVKFRSFDTADKHGREAFRGHPENITWWIADLGDALHKR